MLTIRPSFTTLGVAAAVLLTVVILAACAPAATPTPTPEPKGGGGEFRVVLSGEPTSLNPDLRVRQAINTAINRSVVVNRAFVGLGTPATGLYTPAIPWAYNANAQTPAFDVAGAEKLRAKAYFRAQEILARDLPLAPLVDSALIVLARDNVTGLGYTEARGRVTFQTESPFRNYSRVRVKR